MYKVSDTALEGMYPIIVIILGMSRNDSFEVFACDGIMGLRINDSMSMVQVMVFNSIVLVEKEVSGAMFGKNVLAILDVWVIVFEDVLFGVRVRKD